MDDWGRLLSGCGVNSSTVGSNPTLPATWSGPSVTTKVTDFLLVEGYWWSADDDEWWND